MVVRNQEGAVTDQFGKVIADFQLDSLAEIICFNGEPKFRDLVFLALREHKSRIAGEQA